MTPFHKLLMVSTHILLQATLSVAVPDYYHDVVVYGSTPAGIMAAVSAVRVGRRNQTTVALLSVTRHIGGMSASGLGKTDSGPYPEHTIGGLAREFFERNGAQYNISDCCEWNLEPHVAEQIFQTMLEESGVTVFLAVGDVRSVSKSFGGSSRLRSIETEKGMFGGSIFVDASYEGDVLALAGVSHSIGREGQDAYGESFAGVLGHADGHSFVLPVDPFVDANQTELLPLMTGIHQAEDSKRGQGDDKVQSYNFRLCMSKTNKVPMTAPRDYHPERWELFRRYINELEAANLTNRYVTYPSTNTRSVAGVDKYDCNNAGAISTDFVGGSWKYPTATYEERKLIWEEHKQYMLELFWFLKTDSAVPVYIRKRADDWGLCADEFVDTDYWPPQLYVREARRMIGDSVFTQVDIESQSTGDIGLQSIGLGSYNYDSHNAQRVVRRYSSNQWPYAWNEGDLEQSPRTIYQIPVGVLFPARNETANILSPVSLSASHVAFNTLRMEPQFMILGQAAGTIASLILKSNQDFVQDVDLHELRQQLLLDGQLIARKKGPKDNENEWVAHDQ